MVCVINEPASVSLVWMEAQARALDAMGSVQQFDGRIGASVSLDQHNDNGVLLSRSGLGIKKWCC